MTAAVQSMDTQARENTRSSQANASALDFPQFARTAVETICLCSRGLTEREREREREMADRFPILRETSPYNGMALKWPGSFHPEEAICLRRPLSLLLAQQQESSGSRSLDTPRLRLASLCARSQNGNRSVRLNRGILKHTCPK